MALLIVIKIGLCGLYLCLVFQYEEQRADLHAACVLADVFSWQLYHRILFQPDVAGQHCHAAVCDDGDRADFKGERGSLFCISLFYALYCNYYIGFAALACFPAFNFVVLWISAREIKIKKHHYFSSQFRLACPALQEVWQPWYCCRPMSHLALRSLRRTVSKPDQAVCQ